jgi:hypothetical protein
MWRCSLRSLTVALRSLGGCAARRRGDHIAAVRLLFEVAAVIHGYPKFCSCWEHRCPDIVSRTRDVEQSARRVDEC